jgi:hypothetical protein
MGSTKKRTDEAVAVARIAEASRQVQAAAKVLEDLFNESTDDSGATLPLARLTAAMAELQAAREALDVLLARKALH